MLPLDKLHRIVSLFSRVYDGHGVKVEFTEDEYTEETELVVKQGDQILAYMNEDGKTFMRVDNLTQKQQDVLEQVTGTAEQERFKNLDT